MATDLRTKYGSSNQALTITLASLASSSTAGRQSDAVDNTSNLFREVLITVKIKLQAGSPASDKAVYVYAAGTVDGGTTYTGNVGSSDAAYTQDDPTTLKCIGVIPCPNSGALTYIGTFALSVGFGGRIPAKWVLVIRNFTGVTFSATAGDHAAVYQGQLDEAA